MRHGGLTLLNPYALFERVGLSSGCVMADLGCGSLGHFVFPAAEIVGPSGCVYAVDVQQASLRLIERELREHQAWHVKPIWSDVENARQTLVPPLVADLTLIVNALYLARMRERWVEEAFRVTKPDGCALVIDWHPAALPLGPPRDTRLHPDSVRDLFEARGWITEADFDAGDHHYAFLFRRPDEPTALIESTSHPSSL